MAKHQVTGRQKTKGKKAEGEERGKQEPGSVLNWGPVVIQVIVFGGLMFLFQQVYVSLGTHDSIRYFYTDPGSFPDAQLTRVTVNKIGKKNYHVSAHLDARWRYSARPRRRLHLRTEFL